MEEPRKTFGQRICECLENENERKLLIGVSLFLLNMEDEVHSYWYWAGFWKMNNN